MRFPTRTGIAIWMDRQHWQSSTKDRPPAPTSPDTRIGRGNTGSRQRPHALEGSTSVENEAYRWVTEGAGENDLDRQQESPSEERQTAGTWFGTMTPDDSTSARSGPFDSRPAPDSP